jgi:hypothetical protein
MFVFPIRKHFTRHVNGGDHNPVVLNKEDAVDLLGNASMRCGLASHSSAQSSRGYVNSL